MVVMNGVVVVMDVVIVVAMTFVIVMDVPLYVSMLVIVVVVMIIIGLQRTDEDAAMARWAP